MRFKKCSRCTEMVDVRYFIDNKSYCGFCEMRLEKEQTSVSELEDHELTDLGIYIKRKKKFMQKVDDFIKGND